jgi:hypothetical protein
VPPVTVDNCYGNLHSWGKGIGGTGLSLPITFKNTVMPGAVVHTCNPSTGRLRQEFKASLGFIQ